MLQPDTTQLFANSALQSQQIFQCLNIPHLIHDADLGVYLKYVGDVGPLSHIFPLEMLS